VLEDERLVERSAELGEWLGGKLRALAEKHPSVGDVRGMGLFWTLELVKDRATKEPLRKATEKYLRTIVKDVSEYLFREKNVYVPSDKFGIWVVPPLVVTREELEFVVAAIDDALTLADEHVAGSRISKPRASGKRA
jgi:taurine--2-oxoglutarate transaminase